MKKIVVDLYKIKNLYSGLGQFSLHYSNQLISKRIRDFQLKFLIPRGSHKELFYPDPQISFIYDSIQSRYFSYFNTNYDIWHSLHQFPSHFPGRNGCWILTIHDLNFLHEKNERKSSIYLKKLQSNIDKANCITTISNYSKSMIEKYLDLKGKEVHVIYNGIAQHPHPSSNRPSFIDNEKFFFSIGIFNKKKNFHALLPLMKYFKDYKLVVAGNYNTAYGSEFQSDIRRMKLEDNVILPGEISDTDKYWLYNNCAAFLFPSLAEGFGMPVIEAMMAGRAVFTSKYTSLPEIGGDAAFYFDNFDPWEMYKVIEAGLEQFHGNSDFFRKEVIRHTEKFSWEHCIERYIDLYHNL